MYLKSLYDEINEAGVLEDNENLSLPIIRTKEKQLLIIFFTYVIIEDIQHSVTNYHPSRFITISKEGKAEIRDINAFGYTLEKWVKKFDESESRIFDYESLLILMEKMVTNDFEVEDVTEFLKAFESSIPEPLLTTYQVLGKDFFDFLSSKIQ